MDRKKLIPFINAENEMAGSVISLADRYSCEGADGLYLYNFSGDDKSREEFLGVVRSIEKQIDVPFVVGLYVERFEDAKKALYTGASKVVLRKALLPEEKELKEKIGIKKTIKDYGVDEAYFLEKLDEMTEQAFDDQCTGANPRLPLMSEIKEMYLEAYYGGKQ